jgi:hypothetical protein
MAKRKNMMAAAAGSPADDFVNGAPDMKEKRGGLGRPKTVVGETTKLTLDIEVERAAAFKVLAAKRRTTMRAMIEAFMDQEIAKDA